MKANQTYAILCRVSGGCTGTREALLKVDGAVRLFTREAAEREAARLNARMNSPHSTATFSYRAIEIR